MIVVANASFLLNFSLVDPDKEILADCLLDELQAGGEEVLFLESGPQPIAVSDSDYENHNSWAWIAEAPLRYIVPHFLLWGMLFCFVFFPVFGRPRRTAKANNSSFQNHIKAMAKQLERSGRPLEAANRIQHYHELTGERQPRQRDGN